MWVLPDHRRALKVLKMRLNRALYNESAQHDTTLRVGIAAVRAQVR